MHPAPSISRVHYALYKVKVASKDPTQKMRRSLGLKREHLRLLVVGVFLHVCALCECWRTRGVRHGGRTRARFAARAMPLHVLLSWHAPAQNPKES